ncbi:carbohydrate kinase family protein [Sedimentibacter sp. zth1]|uniref:PfkB family carbohydrate kinase n=1 Tax=Sedimentibacter sp. zth1 TaxID=2816908 RepID=UPI001A929906|nr:PfkB family carbohydrate kinase [Sedimentibacter sp. zth1]QSX06510.1 carbohydrate kinase family protein [Sedimentibacter sp. zth1]
MKKVLVIGSTVVDIIINVDFLPSTKQDVHVISHKMSLGGCAYNVSDVLRHFKVPYILFSPVGTGIYGNYVREKLLEKGVPSPIPIAEIENGCCYCFVEPSGERTFISNHGAEYLIYKKWLEQIDMSQISSVYICGLEIEEKTGIDIVEFLEDHKNVQVYFAPGPRINKIPKQLLDRIFKLSPILHLNDDEALGYTKSGNLLNAAEIINKKTNNTVIITCGSEGVYYYNNNILNKIDAFKVEQIDTIGAGDSHIGATIASISRGNNLETALSNANRVSSVVVNSNGALLSDEAFKEIKKDIQV